MLYSRETSGRGYGHWFMVAPPRTITDAEIGELLQRTEASVSDLYREPRAERVIWPRAEGDRPARESFCRSVSVSLRGSGAQCLAVDPRGTSRRARWFEADVGEPGRESRRRRAPSRERAGRADALR